MSDPLETIEQANPERALLDPGSLGDLLKAELAVETENDDLSALVSKSIHRKPHSRELADELDPIVWRR